MSTAAKFRKDLKINWYRTKVDQQLMSKLMQTSDFRGFRQVFFQLSLFFITATLACMVFRNVHTTNWFWSVPLLILALFVHGTNGPFMGMVAVHELSHKTVFKSKAWNEFFLKLYAFISWSDYVWFRPSHVKHHQFTVHKDYDGEVVLPQVQDFKDWQFWLRVLAWNPLFTWGVLKAFYQRATGRIEGDWYVHILPETNVNLRREHRDWARFVLFGHLALALAFILTGHWFLIVVFTFGTHYCAWLGVLCGTPQHYGLTPNTTDFRLCCRTYTCSWLTSFYYWNMQYHIEHHMFPAVPFYNLPRLRKVLQHDLPPAPHGLWATWKGLLEIHNKQKVDPNYVFVPPLPQSAGERAEADVLEREAALTS